MKVLSENHQNQAKPWILTQYLQISNINLISEGFEKKVNLVILIYSQKKYYPRRISIGGIFTIFLPLSHPNKIVNAVMAT